MLLYVIIFARDECKNKWIYFAIFQFHIAVVQSDFVNWYQLYWTEEKVYFSINLKFDDSFKTSWILMYANFAKSPTNWQFNVSNLWYLFHQT